MKCYLCNSGVFKTRDGEVRDAPALKVLECLGCGLVTLSSLGHIQNGFYEDSGMHGANSISIDNWLKDVDWDDQRRFDMLKPIIKNKHLLDFGCGAGGFLNKARHLAATINGVELERRVQEYWRGKIKISSSIEMVDGNCDLITAFHVVEHLPDPVDTLKSLANKLSSEGRMVIEVPNSEDVLLTLYESDAFQRFTYWSQHLFLFNPETLERLLHKAGLRILSIQQCQRYPISNHLHWLAKGLPGGHQRWSFLDTPHLKAAYADALAAIGKCDTLLAHVELDK
ncbi:class I SAM-dependent methyltransferase [Polynucleobacter paneuropaeus]|nr:class I SAM-dependent methyltransferase [Polynucleobacter paneuropaeus]